MPTFCKVSDDSILKGAVKIKKTIALGAAVRRAFHCTSLPGSIYFPTGGVSNPGVGSTGSRNAETSLSKSSITSFDTTFTAVSPFTWAKMPSFVSLPNRQSACISSPFLRSAINDRSRYFRIMKRLPNSALSLLFLWIVPLSEGRLPESSENCWPGILSKSLYNFRQAHGRS